MTPAWPPNCPPLCLLPFSQPRPCWDRRANLLPPPSRKAFLRNDFQWKQPSDGTKQILSSSLLFQLHLRPQSKTLWLKDLSALARASDSSGAAPKHPTKPTAQRWEGCREAPRTAVGEALQLPSVELQPIHLAQPLARLSVAPRLTRCRVPLQALIKAACPGWSQIASKVHILRLQQRRGQSRTGICCCLFISGKGEMAPRPVCSSTRGRELLRVAYHDCRRAPTPLLLHRVPKASCNTVKNKMIKEDVLHTSLKPSPPLNHHFCLWKSILPYCVKEKTPVTECFKVKNPPVQPKTSPRAK